jgi:inorganic phosphate transporter, PiT family
MQVETVLTILVLLAGFYMAWNIGANDVSNAMGTSVGSGALTLKRAVIIAAIFEFSGAFFVGGNVSQTIQSGLIDAAAFTNQPLILILGFVGALLGTSVWLQVASFFGWPVSTTHAIVGAIIGFGAIIGGIGSIQWNEVGGIALSWVISPLLSGFISYFIFSFLQRQILFALSPMDATRRLLPWFVFIVFGTFTLSLIYNGLKNLKLSLTFLQGLEAAAIVSTIAALLTFLIIKKVHPTPKPLKSPSMQTPQIVVSLNKAIKHLQRVKISTKDETYDKVSRILGEVKGLSKSLTVENQFVERTSEYQQVEKMFVFMQVLSACFVAFAHGANDVANAIGPVSAVLDLVKNGAIGLNTPISTWVLALGGAGIVIGLATWGWRVIMTIGTKITVLTPTRGFCAEFGAATTILLASKLGLPISTTHCLVGSVLGVGIAGGIKALNLNTVRDIGLSWVITLPASALSSIVFFYILRLIFIH